MSYLTAKQLLQRRTQHENIAIHNLQRGDTCMKTYVRGSNSTAMSRIITHEPTKHFKERVMVDVLADIVQVVVLAARANTLLRVHSALQANQVRSSSDLQKISSSRCFHKLMHRRPCVEMFERWSVNGNRSFPLLAVEETVLHIRKLTYKRLCAEMYVR